MAIKNKKRFFVLLTIGILITALIIAYFTCSLFYGVRNFSLEDYSGFIDEPPTWYEKHEGTDWGKIDTASEARKVAVKVFREVYYDNSVAKTPPYIVSYDSQNDAWLVQAGMCFVPEWGAHVIISASDGKILGLWNYKF